VSKPEAIVVDTSARVVRRGTDEVHLVPKAFDLLVSLVAHRPSVVPHDELHALLWPGVHVSETSLAALITQLRKALGDTSSAERMIRTVHRVGYAFVGDASLAGESAVSHASAWRLLWRGQSIIVPNGESIIGRDPMCALQLDADSISRQHARLVVAGPTASIEDLGSKNGTWLAGERLLARTPVADGTSVRLGSETIRFEAGRNDKPTQTAAPDT
jgi:DNA-binding winged helix-turn-helix (wHTH) protein